MEIKQNNKKPRNNRITLGWWLNDFYAYKSKIVKPSTLRNIGIVIRCHVPQDIADIRLAKLTIDNAESLIYAVDSMRMRQCTLQVLNEALERAKKHGYIRDNPFALVEPIKHKQKRGMALTNLECKRLLDKVSSPGLRLLYEFYMYSGCRRAEALALTWNDIDLQAMILHIQGTKTEDSDRYLPISEPLLKVIKKIPKTGLKLFEYSPDYVSKQFHRVLPNHKLHDLRHTFATKCMESGIALKTIQAWLGHSSMDITEKIYLHLINDFQRQEAHKLC